VYRIADDKYWVRAKATDLRTGKKKEVEKLLEGVSLQEAAQQRAALIEVAKNPAPSMKRMRVREYAKEWLESKKLRIDPSTAKTYEAAIEKRILPTLGDYYFDAHFLRRAEVDRRDDQARLVVGREGQQEREDQEGAPEVHAQGDGGLVPRSPNDGS
jgi:hypothetical protein